jgi:hypothetical protein
LSVDEQAVADVLHVAGGHAERAAAHERISAAKQCIEATFEEDRDHGGLLFWRLRTCDSRGRAGSEKSGGTLQA